MFDMFFSTKFIYIYFYINDYINIFNCLIALPSERGHFWTRFFKFYNDVKFASDSFQAVFFVNITFLVILDQ